jgi:hypothetical protein
MRAILSIIIVLTMICYNIKTKPCYVDKVGTLKNMQLQGVSSPWTL